MNTKNRPEISTIEKNIPINIYKNIYKVEGGKLIRISLELNNNKIKNIKITGDFFIHPENTIENIEQKLIGCKFAKEDIFNKVSPFFIKAEHFGFDAFHLTEAIAGVKQLK